VRKLSGTMLMILMALFLVACGGGEDEEDDPVAVVDAPTAEEEAEPTATELALDDEGTPDEAILIATPGADGSPTSAVVPAGATPAVDGSPELAASPVVGGFPVLGVTPGVIASPGVTASPGAMASPIVVGPALDATPGVMASPVSATPAGGIVIVLPDTEDESTPADDAAATTTLNGRVELAGNVNEAYVLTDDGCVGLGANADLREGRQVVVRSETGTIVGVTTLQATDAGDECAWTFSVEVPESEFYAVSIPMTTELVFTQDDIEENDGEITILLP
jgi:hypothetical protein